MDDPRIIKLSNEHRAYCEDFSELYWKLKKFAVGAPAIYTDIPNDELDIVDDNRLTENRINGKRLHDFRNTAIAFIQLIETGDNLDIINHPCVKTLWAN